MLVNEKIVATKMHKSHKTALLEKIAHEFHESTRIKNCETKKIIATKRHKNHKTAGGMLFHFSFSYLKREMKQHDGMLYAALQTWS